MVVLGGGMAGCAAALAAAEALGDPSQVVLLRRSLGATAVSTGAVDLADDPDFRRQDPLARETDVARILSTLLDREGSRHPYARLGGGASRAASLAREGWEALARWTDGLVSGGLRNAPLATSFGTFRFASGALATQWGGDLIGLGRARLLVVGLSGLGSFDAPFVASALPRWTPLARAEAVVVSVPPFVGAGDLNPFDLARALDDEGRVRDLASAVARSSSSLAYEAVLFPPVLGLERSREAVRTLAESLGRPVFEALAGLPSVPGARLQQALDRALQRGGVSLIEAEVSGFRRVGARLTGLLLKDGSLLPLEESASAVLATGGLLGGGLMHEDGVREPVFDLPVDCAGGWARRLGNDDLLGKRYADPHPLFSTGVRLDARLRPTDEGGEAPCFSNLFAAGDVVAGHDRVAGKEGLGVALLLGRAAGGSAAGGEGHP